MGLIIRIDVDRPYGRSPWPRHLLSRVSSDLFFPKIIGLGYLAELQAMLALLNHEGARAYLFFRRCTLPSDRILEMVEAGGHKIGLHLENSRSFTSFLKEKEIVEHHSGKKIEAVSKHGSGGAKYGFHHYAPYEPDKYIEWAEKSAMRLFLGNLEDPCIEPLTTARGLLVFPAAFWLEPAWRNTETFTVDWLLERGRKQDIVLLVHPENVLAQPQLVAYFRQLVSTVESRILP